ncbi:MAG: DUF6765 family protein [bacterium]
MEKSSHYYAVLALSRICGMKKYVALRLAYASQYVDDAKINHLGFEKPKVTDELFEERDGKQILVNVATCHSYFMIKTLNYQAMINNTAAFHFVPGCKGKVFTKKMRCAADSKVINKIITKSYKAEPEQFGMLLHTYADTFAHQGFSGLISKENDIEKLKGKPLDVNWKTKGIKLLKWFTKKKFDLYFDKIMPAYGHGQAAMNPDTPYLKWSYEFDPSDTFKGLAYEKSKVDNKKRFTLAFKKIKEKIDTYLEKNPAFKEKNLSGNEHLEKFFEILVKQAKIKKKIKMWQRFMYDRELFEKDQDKIKYNDQKWLKEAFVDYNKKKFNARKVLDVTLKKDYQDTSWYKYVKAVKWYKKQLFPALKKQGLDIPNY